MCNVNHLRCIKLPLNVINSNKEGQIERWFIVVFLSTLSTSLSADTRATLGTYCTHIPGAGRTAVQAQLETSYIHTAIDPEQSIRPSQGESHSDACPICIDLSSFRKSILNSSLLHQVKKKKIKTVKEVMIPGRNCHRF